MKLTIKQLRVLVQETIEELSEAKDKDLAIGDVVGVVVNNRPVKGKVVDRYAAKFADPMAKGKLMMPKEAGRMMWSVDIGGRTHQVPADELEIVQSVRDKVSGKNPRPQWKTDLNTKKTQEAIAIGGMSTMLKGNDVPEDDDTEKPKVPAHRDDLLTDDDSLVETDENREQEHFEERRYDTIAKQLVNGWEEKQPGANWKAITKSYCRAKKSQTGKTLDPNALFAAVCRYMTTDGDERNANLLGGTHYQYK